MYIIGLQRFSSPKFIPNTHREGMQVATALRSLDVDCMKVMWRGPKIVRLTSKREKIIAPLIWELEKTAAQSAVDQTVRTSC